MLKKYFILVFACFILISALPGCSGKQPNNPAPDDGNTKTQTRGPEEADAAAKEKIIYAPGFEVKDWGGREFIFLCTGPEYLYGYYETKDIYVEQMTGEVFGDAVYSRNMAVEEKYNIAIKEIKTMNVSGDAVKAYKANDDLYNAIFEMPHKTIPISQSGYLLDFNTIPNVDLSQPWWDQNFKNDMSIAKKTYIMTGDISTVDDESTHVIFFNKKLIKDYSRTDPYELLRNNNWVLDEYEKLIKAVSKDLNGDGVMDHNDQFGTIMGINKPRFMMMGSGAKFSELDGGGYPQITFMGEKTIQVVSKLFDLYFDGNICIFFEDLSKIDSAGNGYKLGRELFCNDQMLFCIGEQGVIVEFRNMESEFGIVPIPKYDSGQDRYYSPVDGTSIFLSVPGTVKDTDFTGYVLEAFAAESKNIVTPAYYDIMMKRKYVRDDESETSLDIAAETRLYDPACYYNWGGLGDMLMHLLLARSKDIASSYEKIANIVDRDVEKSYNAFLQIDN